MQRYRPAVVLALLLAVLVVACGSPKPPEPQPQVDPATAEVKDVIQNFAAAKSFRAQLAAQVQQPNGNITTSEFNYEFLPPDRFHFQAKGSDNATRVVAGETFARTNGVWTLLKEWSGDEYGGANRLFDANVLNRISDDIGKTTTVTKGGTDTVDGKQCQLYTLAGTSSGNRMEMCVADRYPIRMVSYSGTLATTALLRDFNTNIVIDRPPVQ
jgi:outer membrane lipoprotein-sorting protein